MGIRVDPVTELLSSAESFWRAKRPALTVEKTDKQLTDAIGYEREMEGWTKERWQEERDNNHAACVTRARSLENDFASLARQQAVCAALIPRYAEGTAEREALKKLLEHLQNEHARMSRHAQTPRKMPLRDYRRRRFSQNKAVIRRLSETLTSLKAEWLTYNRERAELYTVARILDDNRSTSAPA